MSENGMTRRDTGAVEYANYNDPHPGRFGTRQELVIPVILA